MRGRARAAGRGARGVRAVGDARDADRRGHGQRAAARVRGRASWSATCPSPRSSTSARSTTSSPQEPADRLAVFATPARGWRRTRTASRRCRALLGSENVAQPALGVRAVRLHGRQPHRAPAGAGRRGRAAARARRRRRPIARSPSRSTATGAASPATRTSARPRRSASAPPTSPAWAPSRSASRTASTSAIPRSRTSPGS